MTKLDSISKRKGFVRFVMLHSNRVRVVVINAIHPMKSVRVLKNVDYAAPFTIHMTVLPNHPVKRI